MKRLLIFISVLFLAATAGYSQTMFTAHGAARAHKVAAGGGGGGGGTTFVLSGHSITLRHDATINIGYSFIPTADGHITDLGRIKVTGNTHDHTIYLIDPNGSTILASAVVLGTDLAAASVDSYVFTSITPVAVTVAGAGVSGYFIVSSEIQNLDDWYDDTGLLTTSGDATIIHSVFFNGGGYSAHSAGAFGYGIPNFKITVP